MEKLERGTTGFVHGVVAVVSTLCMARVLGPEGIGKNEEMKYVDIVLRDGLYCS